MILHPYEDGTSELHVELSESQVYVTAIDHLHDVAAGSGLDIEQVRDLHDVLGRWLDLSPTQQPEEGR